MKRKMYDKLAEWKKGEKRKPLFLMGARQVGKTYLLKEFGEKEFKNVVYLSLDVEKARFETIFEDTIEPSELIEKIEILKNIKITPEDTLLIFDEIQEIPRAMTALKYFCEEAPEYFVAASGSFLGVALAQGTSFPVGKVEILELEPLDFEEFLEATGNERFLRTLEKKEEIKLFADKFEKIFRQYLVVGGMPEAVKSFVENQDFSEVDKIQNAILLAYLNDISKHTDNTTAVRIHQVWNSLVEQFGRRNGKFMFGLIRDGARAREYELAIQWLVDCRIVRKVENIKVGDKLPLKAYADGNAFKLYFLDIGLFRHLAGLSGEVILDDDAIFKEFSGLFAEQFVLQQMSQDFEMFYWDSDANAEVDFVTEIDGKVVPIEVKSGKNVKAKSLRVFREKYEPKIAVRFSLLDFEENGGLVNIPIYLAGFLRKILFTI